MPTTTGRPSSRAASTASRAQSGRRTWGAPTPSPPARARHAPNPVLIAQLGVLATVWSVRARGPRRIHRPDAARTRAKGRRRALSGPRGAEAGVAPGSKSPIGAWYNTPWLHRHWGIPAPAVASQAFRRPRSAVGADTLAAIEDTGARIRVPAATGACDAPRSFTGLATPSPALPSSAATTIGNGMTATR